ncbi:hypothetical protein Clole_0829 [Cellulosilyticum lentocellum DSM 5427]|uniref:Uncharacterized protein n=1 Tax=Cellulosilyticum lentocellum (strain ATCC 49066 / DSM 5427 / NCIMB 11756 / RHM5) TaxID=642492 RepID=F2JQ14_CELLD|nr:hypothetical protein Clole_0829 [Cellulosilyticum lentocellum DSM 5427]
MRKWYICPHCGYKLLQYEDGKAESKCTYIKCKRCKKEIEIKIAT